MEPFEALELSEREAKDIHLALYYAKYLAHGVSGHNQLMVMAKLATYMGFALEGTGLRLPEFAVMTTANARFQ